MTRINDSFDRYTLAENDLYDNLLTGKQWYHRLYNYIFWQERDSYQQAHMVLKYLPKDFKGKLLDVPAGTGVFTADRYRDMPEADIHLLDYSSSMLQSYRHRLGQLPQVQYVQGDVGELPYPNKHFDGVLSMHGLHCFPDKDAALSEIKRVLSAHGFFIGCSYVSEVQPISDFFVKNIYERKGIFIPPFDTAQGLSRRLHHYFKVNKYHIHGAFAIFRCHLP